MLRIEGLDQLQRRLEEMQRAAADLDGEQSVPLPDLMPDAFVSSHTRFASLQEMVDAGGVDEPADLLGPEWDAFVASHSTFANWDDMQKAAVAEWTRRKLGFE